MLQRVMSLKLSIQLHTESSSTLTQIGQRLNALKRKCPTTFTECQLAELRKWFKSSPYIEGEEKTLLARNLGISTERVKSWFTRERKIQKKKANEIGHG